MFGVLNIAEAEKGIINRLKYMFSPPEPILERMNIEGSAPFFELTVTKDRDGNINYDEIYRILGRCASRLLVTNNEKITESEKIKLYRPTIFPPLVMLNSAIRMIEKYGMSPNFASAAIIDGKTAFPKKLIKIVPLVSSIRIITDTPEKYDAFCEKILDEWGLAITVSENSADANNCNFVISPFPENENELFGYFSILDKESGKKTVFSGDGIKIPDEYESVMPQFVDPMLFLSALFELCGAKGLDELCFDRMTIKEQ